METPRAKQVTHLLIGWACLVVGLVTMCFSLWLFPIYGLLYGAALTIAIIAMTKQRVVAGVCLLVALLLVPTTVGVFLAAYRTAVALENGVGFLQKHADAFTLEGQQSRNARRIEAEHAEWVALHRADPAFGEWMALRWDADGKPMVEDGGLGGFQRYDKQTMVFMMPLDEGLHEFRVFTIAGNGRRGEWHVDSGYDHTKGWFEIDSRPDLKSTDRIDFQWNDDPSTEAPKRGSFRRNWLQSAPTKSG